MLSLILCASVWKSVILHNMKTAGDILSALFDERFMKTAQGYSDFFSSWADITAKNGIAAASEHSRIKNLDRGIVQIEMDHPGWKQLLQTKQSKLLHDFQYRFPQMNISGIALMLGQSDNLHSKTKQEIITESEAVEPVQAKASVKNAVAGYDLIKDEEFKEKLIQLEQAIASRGI